ncbi:MAG: hypothetical protein ACLUYV_04240 [Alistipes shahii]
MNKPYRQSARRRIVKTKNCSKKFVPLQQSGGVIIISWARTASFADAGGKKAEFAEFSHAGIAAFWWRKVANTVFSRLAVRTRCPVGKSGAHTDLPTKRLKDAANAGSGRLFAGL